MQISTQSHGKRATKRKLDSLMNERLDKSLPDILTVASQFWECANTPTSLGLFLCSKYKDLTELTTHKVEPRWYLTARDYFLDTQACKLLSKLKVDTEQVLALGFTCPDPVKTAMDTFVSCESVNAIENDFWESIQSSSASLTPNLRKVVDRAVCVINSLIGESFPLSEVVERARFGNGVVAFTEKSRTDVAKFREPLTCTAGLGNLAEVVLRNQYPGWWSGVTWGGIHPANIREVRGGKFAQVPKAVKSHRNIEIQPGFNVFMQLGVGKTLRHLMRDRVNLSDQRINQRRAFEGSLISGKLGTIDLSNASDTISKGLVKTLLFDGLPDSRHKPSKGVKAMYRLMNLLRTDELEVAPGDWRKLHRFSSMGNGFTFELESLLFYSIAVAASNKEWSRFRTGKRPDVTVYGDDIIVNVDCFRQVVTSLESMGFSVNRDKSYGEGPFRESCGKDYFNGVLVRPYYIKEIPQNEAEVIRLVNGLSRTANRCNNGYGFDSVFIPCIKCAHQLLSPLVADSLAIGWPAGDEYLIGSNWRDGYAIYPDPGTRTIDSYYIGKTTALYRAFVRFAHESTENTAVTSGVVTESAGESFRTKYVRPWLTRRNWGPNPDEPVTFRLPALVWEPRRIAA